MKLLKDDKKNLLTGKLKIVSFVIDAQTNDKLNDLIQDYFNGDNNRCFKTIIEKQFEIMKNLQSHCNDINNILN